MLLRCKWMSSVSLWEASAMKRAVHNLIHTYVHMHIPHYWMLKGPFLELNSIGPVLALSFSPFHCTDCPVFSSLSIRSAHSILPNHFSINMNQNQSPWRWRQYIVRKPKIRLSTDQLGKSVSCSLDRWKSGSQTATVPSAHKYNSNICSTTI